MPASTTRTFLLALGLLVAAFGLISVFTPRGFSWEMECLGVLLTLPWLVRWARGHTAGTSAGGRDVPEWHPESDAHQR